jgi:hypothetical protein
MPDVLYLLKFLKNCDMVSMTASMSVEMTPVVCDPVCRGCRDFVVLVRGVLSGIWLIGWSVSSAYRVGCSGSRGGSGTSGSREV